jgi:esterase/lipase
VKVNNYILADDTPWRLFIPDSAHDGWVVLWLQGFESTVDGHHEGCERMSAASDVPFAILNYAGHGNHPVSLEKATRKQQFEEVCAVYDELVHRGFDKIIVIGGSFGGYMAALLTSVRKPRAVVLRAVANYKDEEFDYPYAQTIESKDGEAKDLYRQSIDTTYSNKAIEALRSFDGASYIIEHEADTVVTANIPQSYYHAAQHGSYIAIQGLKHSPKLMPNATEWFDIIEHWMLTIIYATVHDPRGKS